MVEPTASGVFCNRMLSMVNSEDVNAIIQAQRHMWVAWCDYSVKFDVALDCLIENGCAVLCDPHTCLVLCKPASEDTYCWIIVKTGLTGLRRLMKCWSTSTGCLTFDYSRWTSASCSTPAASWRWRKIWTASSEGSGKSLLLTLKQPFEDLSKSEDWPKCSRFLNQF